MARGDGGKPIFGADDDRKAFLFRLGQVCASHGWRVHAWVLIGNHFHLLLETPEPNLVRGMKYLLGTFSQGWNARRSRRGHVFQSRYKSVPVSAAVESPYYFRIVADYIHLNPARAGLVGGNSRKLIGYKWSSLPCYASGKGPDWLALNRVLDAFELAKDGRGRRAYLAWLEARAETMEPIEPPWQAIKEWIPDDEPDLDWFNRPRNPSNPDPEAFDHSPTWQATEIHLDDGRTLVLEYT